MLGSSYGGGTGAELGRLVVYLAPWMVASVAVTVAYPLLFVRGRARWLPRSPCSRSLLHVLVEWVLQRAVRPRRASPSASARSTALVLVAILHALRAVRRTAYGLAARGCRLRRARCSPPSGCPGSSSGRSPAAVVGLIAYVVVLAAWRPAGLRDAWAYVRALQ